METLRSFAERHKARINDGRQEAKYGLETSEDTIYGKWGEIVADPSYQAFAVKFIAVPRNAIMTGALRSRFNQALAGGLKLKARYGDAESTFHFDPSNENQSKLALKLVGSKTRRTVTMTTDQKTALVERLRAARTASTMPVLA